MSIKFADPTVVGLIRGNEESMHRDKVNHLETRCRDKMKEVIVVLQKSRPEYTPLNISGSTVERVDDQVPWSTDF